MAQINAKNEVTLDIETLSYGPYGIARLNGKTVMIPDTAPGDTVVAEIVETRDRYAVARTVRRVHASEMRQFPPCAYAGECGGCSWQHIDYQAQLAAKQQSVGDALRRIGKLYDFDLRPIIASPGPYHYRRRIRLQRAGGDVGFYRARSRVLVPIERCLIADERVNETLEPLRAWSAAAKTPIDNVEVVTGDDAGVVIVAQATGPFRPEDEAGCAALVRAGTIRGLIARGNGWRRHWGDTMVRLDLAPDVFLTLDADVFTQVNPAGNRVLLRELLDHGVFAAADRVLELYAGAGNFTLPIARRSGSVLAVEGERRAVEGARRSAGLNGIDNVTWMCAPMAAAVARLTKSRATFSKIVLDPPRAGAKGIERGLARLGGETIIYVSCDPATLARDLAGLSRYGYKLKTIQPIDLFPQTYHVEALAVLYR